MNRANSAILRARSWFASSNLALILGLTGAWAALAPVPMWGQWSGTNPVWTNSNVGIGVTTPAFKLHVVGIAYNAGIEATGNNYNVLEFKTATAASADKGTVLRFTNPAAAVNGKIYDIVVGNGGWFFNTYNDDFTGGATRMYLGRSGNVGIGTTTPQYKLAVNGNIGAKDIIVTNSGWADYVFQPGYRLRPLSEVHSYIQQHRHLPEVPSEAEVKEKGVSVGEMQVKLLAKVEELTLHLIQQEKENEELRERLGQLEQIVSARKVSDGQSRRGKTR